MWSQGFTLIELLVSMAIGSMLLLTLTQVVQASKTAYRLQEGLSRLQESGRLAVEMLARDVRMSGFSGCASSQAGNNIRSELFATESETLMSNFQGYRLEGVDDYTDGELARYADSRPFANRSARSRPVTGTDVLILRRPVGEPLRLVADADERVGTLLARSAEGGSVEPGDLLLLSDCEHSRVFRATSSGSWNHGALTVVGFQGRWATQEPIFRRGAELYRLETRVYYVRRGVRGDGNSLYLQQGGESSLPQEVLEGVEDLQIRYGVGGYRGRVLAVQRYLDADAVESEGLWEQVVSLHLQLRLATLQRRLGLPGQSTDGRLRRDFTTFVTLRNRAL